VCPLHPDSAAGMPSAVRLRLKFIMAAAFTICAALQFQNAELDADIVLIVGAVSATRSIARLKQSTA
jgi:hypothetical protein